MLATLSEGRPDADLRNPALIYEPKYDGIRALIALEPDTPSPQVRIWSRLGNDKTAQFPEVVRGLKDFGRRLRNPVLLDGEIVCLDAGKPSFGLLAERFHVTNARRALVLAERSPVTLMTFDLLRLYGVSLLGRRWSELEGRLPACATERGSFMAPFEWTYVAEHPYAKTSKTHEHFAPTPFRHPPYSAACIPFRWMLRGEVEGSEQQEGLAAQLMLDHRTEREPELSWWCLGSSRCAPAACSGCCSRRPART